MQFRLPFIIIVSVCYIAVPDPPSGIKAVGSSPESAFIVSWSAPKSPNGRLLKYHLYIRIVESGSGREMRTLKRTVPPSTWNYEVTELKRREAYEVSISAETAVGEGSQSPSVNFIPSPNGKALYIVICTYFGFGFR